MNDLRTAAQQALEALENSHYDVGSEERQRLGVVDAITALRAALAEPVQEPTLDDAMALPRALAEAYERGWNAAKATGDSLSPSEPVQEGCDHCNHPLYAAIKCKVCGRVAAEPVQERRPIQECYGDCPTEPATCANPCNFEGRIKPVQEPVMARALIEECRSALAEELSAWDIDPPLHHVRQAHDRCVAWLAAPPHHKPLSEEEIDKAYREIWRDLPSDFDHTSSGWIEQGIRYAERAHGIG